MEAGPSIDYTPYPKKCNNIYYSLIKNEYTVYII